jgi:hypothetical protein
MKKCFKCERQLPLADFYELPTMADGHLNKCKDCTKTDARKHRALNLEAISAYERKRFQDPERKRKLLIYQNNLRAKNPLKARAWSMVYREIRAGRLHRKACEVCGEPKTQAHHDDYEKPLDVRWFCFRHHREVGHGQKVIAVGYKR